MRFTPLSAHSLPHSEVFADLRNALDPYHPGLALFAGAVGLLIALWLTAQRARRGVEGDGGGRLAGSGAVGVGLATLLGFVPLGIGIVAAVGAVAAGAGLRRADSRVVGVLGFISLVGVWAAVPDTEPALVVAGVIGVPVLLRRFTDCTIGDRVALVLLVAVTAWIGSAGRVEIVGGLGCVAMLGIGSRRSGERSDSGGGALLFTHLALVVISSRVVTRLSMPWAIAAVVCIAVAGFVAESTIQRIWPTLESEQP